MKIVVSDDALPIDDSRKWLLVRSTVVAVTGQSNEQARLPPQDDSNSIYNEVSIGYYGAILRYNWNLNHWLTDNPGFIRNATTWIAYND